MKYCFITLLSITFIFAFSLDIPVNSITYHFDEYNGFDRLLLDRIQVHPCAPGYPDLPATVYIFVIPQDQEVVDLSIEAAQWRELHGKFDVIPRQRDVAIAQGRLFTEPDPAAYNDPGLLPVEPVVSFDCGTMRGYRLLQVTVCPFRYAPRTSQLYQLMELTINVHTKPCMIPSAPMRVSRFSQQVFMQSLSMIVSNTYDLDNNRCCPATNVIALEGDSIATDLPSLMGPPVDMVIITNNVQKDVYSIYAEMKKRSGIHTVVKTISWIRQHYQGIDDAERMRNFIRDAMNQWGTSFVLLGGDHDYVPTRFVWIDRSVIYTQLWLPFASDLYFSDLDGTWNFDGNDRFGEVSDSLDLYPDVFVGRIPTTDPIQVTEYMSKVNEYIFPTNTAYQEKALFYSSNLETNWPGLPYAYEMSEHLPGRFSKAFIDETLGNLTKEILRDSLNVGFGFIGGVGHGDVNVMCIHFIWPRVYIDNFFFDELMNGPLHGVLGVVTCYTNPFPANCLGEHWVLNPDGGGIGYVGPTSSSEGSIHKEYMKYVLDSLFVHPMAQALGEAKVYYIGNSQWNNWHRVHQLSLTLLGDPTLQVWARNPGIVTPISVQPGTLCVGYDTISITIDPYQKVKRIDGVFYKLHETYKMDSSFTNILSTQIKTGSSGYLTYTMKVPGYIPYIDSVLVMPVGPSVTYLSNAVIDTANNGDGVINPGEMIWLHITLENTGGQIATNVCTQLLCSDTLVTMITDTSSYPDIAPGNNALNTTPFVFSVSEDLPDDHSLDFECIIDHSSNTTQDSFQIIASASDLKYFLNNYQDNGDTIYLTPHVVNYGHTTAQGVTAVLRALSDTITILDSTVTFPSIPPNSAMSSDPDQFLITRLSPNCAVRVQISIQENGVERAIHNIVCQGAPAIDSLRALSGKTSIRLHWQEIQDIAGYRIYRSDQYSGPYAFLGNRLEPIAYYEDFSVPSGIDFYYIVQAVDPSMNQGECSDTVCMRVNPSYAQGWPQDVYGLQYSSPNYGDIDPFYPGLEIVSASLDGNVYAWHYDGTPISSSDARLFDTGSDYIWASPAIGDIDNDGSLEIVFGVMRNTDNLYAIRYNPLDSQVIVLPGWPKTCSGGGFASSPVLSDLDNNGDLEIIALTSFPAHLYVLHHDGTGVYKARTGLLKQLYGDILGTPAVGDIDGDGWNEIVCCGGGQSDSLFVWRSNGQYMEPFPVQTSYNLGHSVVLGDVCGDTDLEICFYAGTPSNHLILMGSDGSELWYNTVLSEYIELAPAIGDVTGDGRPEVVLGYNDGLDNGVMAFDSSGALLPGFPKKGHDAFPPVIADVDQDGSCDIICGSTEWKVYGYSGGGVMIPGFPLMLGNRINSTPAVFDIDLDGALELMISCYDLAFHVFDLDATTYEWPRFHYDPYNSGWYKSGFYGIEEVTQHDQTTGMGIAVFPSPFINELFIRFSNVGEATDRPEVTVYDVAGRLVYRSWAFQNGPLWSVTWKGVDMRGRIVPCGVYFVQVTHEDHESVYKVVKVR